MKKKIRMGTERSANQSLPDISILTIFHQLREYNNIKLLHRLPLVAPVVTPLHYAGQQLIRRRTMCRLGASCAWRTQMRWRNVSWSSRFWVFVFCFCFLGLIFGFRCAFRSISVVFAFPYAGIIYESCSGRTTIHTLKNHLNFGSSSSSSSHFYFPSWSF